ncbi:MFS transporter [Guptibacillus hwajinpoensis]|uniref:Major facilitator superfamily (MFS) profile domain-containing protein n=1 Tax=Guptibacillus hwajinpoensis TaxID=208199 RepID=A0A0J6CXK2_9BACL|nr:MFS transporter [Alkalihalobacillus macyae]KMM36774.1 hypothetical protein AB986_12630 [Alkalihalobacillus macyae]
MKFLSFHRNVKLRLMDSTINILLSTMIFPFLAIYYAKNLGESMAGLILLVSIIFSMAGSMVGGHYSDRMGRKKLLIYASVFRLFFSICIILLHSPLLDVNNYLLIYFTFPLFTLIGIANGVEGPVGQALLIESTGTNERKYMFTIANWFANLAVALGGVAGGFMFNRYTFLLFCLYGLVCFLSFVFKCFIKDTQPVKNNTIRTTKFGIIKTYSILLKDKLMSKYLVALVLIISLELHLTYSVGIRLSQEMHDSSPIEIAKWSIAMSGQEFLGVLLTENTVLVVLLGLFITYLFKYLSEKTILVAGLILYSAGYLMIAASLNIWILLFAMLIATIGELMYLPMRSTYSSRIPPKDQMSTYKALEGMGYYAAEMWASLLVIVAGFIHHSILFIILLITAIIGIVLFKDVATRLDSNISSVRSSA